MILLHCSLSQYLWSAITSQAHCLYRGLPAMVTPSTDSGARLPWLVLGSASQQLCDLREVPNLSLPQIS